MCKRSRKASEDSPEILSPPFDRITSISVVRLKYLNAKTREKSCLCHSTISYDIPNTISAAPPGVRFGGDTYGGRPAEGSGGGGGAPCGRRKIFENFQEIS